MSAAGPEDPPPHPHRTASGGDTGNRARDHLANERTYLSWLRTSLGLLALAAAIARFGPDNPSIRDHLAVAVIGLLGLALLAVGTIRYYEVSRDLEAGLFRTSRKAPIIIAVLTGVAAVVVLPLLL